MKKLMFIFAVPFLAGVVWFLSANNQSQFSDVALANIEAIASGEDAGGVPCFSIYDEYAAGIFVRCGICNYEDGRPLTEVTGMCY